MRWNSRYVFGEALDHYELFLYGEHRVSFASLRNVYGDTLVACSVEDLVVSFSISSSSYYTNPELRLVCLDGLGMEVFASFDLEFLR
jgi:hypothetical protein